MYYTYLWLREDGTPYYVGKGSKDRAFINHGRKVTMCPTDPARILIQGFTSEEEAFAAEVFLISYYGRKDLGSGVLYNQTEGGENPPSFRGRKHSDDTRMRMSQAALGNQRSLGTRKSEEFCRRLSERMLGKRYGLGNKSRTGQKASEETRAKHRAAQVGKTISAEGRENMRLGWIKRRERATA